MDWSDFFPYQTPYAIQQEFMTSAYKTIEEGSIGILSSPTGTGKSLSLLCSILTWLKDSGNLSNSSSVTENDGKSTISCSPSFSGGSNTPNALSPQKKKICCKGHDSDDDWFDQETDENDSIALNGGKTSFLVPVQLTYKNIKHRIFYCSRTHSQLSQCLGELRKMQGKLPITFKSVILGSRKTYCIADEISKKANLQSINEACLNMQRSDRESCRFHNGQRYRGMLEREFKGDKKINGSSANRLPDVEDLCLEGKAGSYCPYYYSRMLASGCEITFLPYNLMLMASARESLGIDLKDSIVILDEAHNLVDAINQMHTIYLSVSQVEQVKQMSMGYLAKFRKKMGRQNTLLIQQLLFIVNALLDTSRIVKAPTSNDRNRMLLETCSSAPDLLAETGEAVWTVNDFIVFSRLEDMNLVSLIDRLESTNLARMIWSFEKRNRIKAGSKGGEKGSTLDVALSISPLATLLDFMGQLMNSGEDGRVFHLNFISGSVDGSANNGKSSSSSSSCFKYLSLNAGRPLEPLLRDCKSILLAGGTMDPIDQFTSSLGLDSSTSIKKINLFQCGHVIAKENLAVFIQGTMTGKVKPCKLILSFETRSNLEMINQYGKKLYETIGSIPEGVIVFFPSHAALASFLGEWKRTDLWHKLNQRKRIFCEGMGGGDATVVFEQYKAFLEMWQKSSLSRRSGEGELCGAMIFCVMSGKLSEGINFSDHLGRGVIVMGVPFANPKDIQVTSRYAYLTRKNPALTLSQYLEIQAMNTVNQSIGRSLRHANDYSVIILMDHRYNRLKSLLPKWIASGLVGKEAQEEAEEAEELLTISEFFRKQQK